ncbi:MAG: nucleotidyl transferase AbiEii/AbiGii toxin family protein [Prosthecobacter sp.]|uniref:nucleotidyl transferase AbiEii/AbiGii toxin family protein n=1 Tax=Prosthecobacter sp. TaxID=1965333 RepID=UPI0038FECA70
MIDPRCFEMEWITHHGEVMRCRSLGLLEKAIVALQLLAHLVESGLPIQFKGGTSLLLRLNPPRRLSIDIDIVTQAAPAELLAVLDTVSKHSPLGGYEHDAERDRELPPKKHFRVFYPSVIEPKRDHVLLDVLFEPEASPHCEPVSIATSFITPEREVRVLVPTVNSLLGDKLTAFAPRTIGILHHERRRTDIVKQLFDVASLFDAATDLAVVADVYAAIHARQLVYRQASYTVEETLNDTIESALLYTQIGLRGGVETPEGLAIAQGVNNLQNHLVNQPFRTDEARLAAAKAACAAAWIQKRPTLTIDDLRFDPAQINQLRDQQIAAPWLPLNRLKGANAEAFHYWFQARRLLIS